MKSIAALLFALGICTQLHAQPFSKGFSFPIPWNDTLTSPWLPSFPARPITEADRVILHPSGHFYSAGKRIRFWGGNLVAAGAFPEKVQAPFIAARMRKLGINVQRFHHLDNPGWSGNEGTLFKDNTTRELNPITLDKLDYLIAHMKQQGVFVNMNLNVSRTFSVNDGIPEADSLVDFAKAVTLFDPYLIQLQKEYAAQLLTHKNPYTGLSLAEDPVLAMLEIVNENSLYGYWKSNALKPFAEGGSLIYRHHRLLQQRWMNFLQNKYSDRNALEQAWAAGASSPGQSNQAPEGTFESNALDSKWIVELHETAQALGDISTTSPASGQGSARVQVSNVTGTDWHIQFKRTGLTVIQDSFYQVRFKARAEQMTSTFVSIMRDNAPFTWYNGFLVNLTPQWKEFSFTIKAPENNTGQVRVSFNLGEQLGTLYIDDFTFGAPTRNGLMPTENLNTTVARHDYADRFEYTAARNADLAAFYIQVQQQFFTDMVDYLKNSLKVKAPITGTNALTGLADIAHQEGLDYIDDHNYWDHPWFPGTPWDINNWRINNRSSLASGLDNIAQIFSGIHKADRPYTISEYNYGFPNRYRQEMVPLLAAYGSFHNSGGIMFFEYNGDRDWTTDKVSNFFSLHQDHSVMALFPSCAAAYRNFYIQPDPQPIVLNYTRKDLNEMPMRDDLFRWDKYVPYDRRINLVRAIKTGNLDAASSTDLTQLPGVPTGVLNSSTQELVYDETNAVHTTSTPVFKSISGYLQRAGGTQLGSMTMNQASAFGVCTWISTDGKPLESAGKSLITLAGTIQNTGMQWQDTTSLGAAFGNAPTQVQSLSASLTLQHQADTLLVHPLDPKGWPKGSPRVLLPDAQGQFSLNLSQEQDQTTWYALEARYAITATQNSVLLNNIKLYPNPAQHVTTLELPIDWKGHALLEVFSMDGKRIWTQTVSGGTTTIPTSTWAPGVYRVQVEGVPSFTWSTLLRVQ